MEFEFAYYDVAVKLVSRNATGDFSQVEKYIYTLN